MITKDNIKEVLESIDQEVLENEMLKLHDYLLIELHVFNSGWFATIESQDYNEEIDRFAEGSGNLFCDKQDFRELCSSMDLECAY